jgi:predicted O-methyltransferase YrrM
VNGVRRPESENPSTITPAQFQSVDDYSNGHSSPAPSAYNEMEFNTKALIPSGAHMVSGRSQGQLLTQFASMSREGRVLELGTFTGYATACLLEGSYNAGQATSAKNGNLNGGPFVLSMERDHKAYEVAVAHLKILSKYGTTGDAAAEALCALRHGDQGAPAVSEDSVVVDYRGVAGCELRRVTDALASLESMASTDDNGVAPFDLVFVDADKTRLLDYVEACLSTDRILKKGGHIIVDNVLWKGLVVEAAQGDFSSSDDDNETDDQLRKNRRARKLANTMHRFNRAIVEDPRVEVLVLPVRDGLSVIRKR